MVNSALSGFFRLSRQDRLAALQDAGALSEEDKKVLGAVAEDEFEVANRMCENCVSVCRFPVRHLEGVAVNNTLVTVPFCLPDAVLIEQLARSQQLCVAGSCVAVATDPVMIGQIHIKNCERTAAQASALLQDRKADIALAVDALSGSLKSRGGGFRDVELLEREGFLVVHVLVDVRDAMGANAINRICEGVAPLLQEILGGEVGFKILSNLSSHRRVVAHALWKGPHVADTLLAWELTNAHPAIQREHTAFVVGAVEGVLLASANDTRAVYAGAHAWSLAHSRRIVELSAGEAKDEILLQIDIPMAVGVVGGSIQSHPTAPAALRLLGSPNARRFTEILGAVCLLASHAFLDALVERADNPHPNKL